MRIEYGIKPNCSEWDSEVESDEYIEEEDLNIKVNNIIQNELKKANKISDWD